MFNITSFENIKKLAIFVILLLNFQILVAHTVNVPVKNLSEIVVDPPCNSDDPVAITSTNYGSLVASASTSGVCAFLTGCNLSNEGRMVDASLTNYATAAFGLSLGATHTLKVENQAAGEFFQAGSFAGFLIENSDVLPISLLSGITVRTYLDGNLKETSSSSSLIGLSIGGDKYHAGFYTTQTYDAIAISIYGGVSLGSTTRVYYAVTNKYCEQTLPLACNTQTLLAKPTFPARIVPERTGVSGTGLNSVVNANNVVDSNPANYASINLVASVSVSASISVKDVYTDYIAGKFAGFDIENTGLVGINLLSGITIKTYLNGSATPQETKTGGNLISANSGLLGGNGRQTVGFVTTLPFDEVRLEINNLLGLLSVTRVYSAIIEEFCAGPALVCNTPIKMAGDNYPVIISGANTGIKNGLLNLPCVACSVSNTQNVVNNTLTDYATITMTAGVDNVGEISVKDVLTDYPAGTFAGFDIENANLIGVNLLSGITIKTYLDGTLKETVTAANLLSINSGLLFGTGRQIVGFVSSQPFDEVKFEQKNLLGLLSVTRIYNAIFEKYCAGPALVCNTPTLLTKPTFPIAIAHERTGISGISLGSIQNASNVVDTDPSNYANINLNVGVLATASLSVKDQFATYPATTFAGFDIENLSLVGVDLLNTITISTYLNGNPVESHTGSAGVVSAGSSLLTGAESIRVGFVTTAPFNEVQITLAQPVSVELGTTRVYGMVLETFCVGPDLTCNTPVEIVGDEFPAFVSSSGIGAAVCLACSVDDAQNVVNSDIADYATITIAVGAGAIGHIAVKDAITDYPTGTFAGFDIENANLIGVDLFSGITIKTYLNGTLKETVAAANLVSVNSGLLFGTGRQIVGFVSSEPFDEVKFEQENLLGLLSVTRVYNAIFEKYCAGPALVCNTPTFLTKPTYPVAIAHERTGLSGISLGSIQNVNNILDSDPANYANINLNVGVLASASLSVKDQFATFPATTFAGFDIENISLLEVDLLNTITINTYLDGILVESKTGASDVVSVGTGLLTGSESIRVGFVTTAPFDEVQITLAQPVSVNIGTTRIYGMVLETFCVGPLDCTDTVVLSNPSHPVIIDNELTGIGGVACVGCEVDNSQNVITQNPSDFALINVVAGVVSDASIAVKNVLTTYPQGTVAGFVIRDRNILLEVDLLNSLTITTYLNGSQQEQKTGFSGLLSLQVLGILNVNPDPTGAYAVGFQTVLPFDEVRITVAPVVGVLNSIEVYGNFVDVSLTNLCLTCVQPTLTVGQLSCQSVTSTYSVNFISNATTVTSTVGTVNMTTHTITDIPLGTDITITATTDTCVTTTDVTGLSSCPTGCEIPNLSAGQGICDGEGATTFTANYVETTGATITVTNGTFTPNGNNTGGTVSGALGTPVIITATNGSCISQITISSPLNCTGLCGKPGITIGGTICGVNGVNYSVLYSLQSGASIAVSVGTISGNIISGIPAGTPLVITISAPDCADRVITMPAPICPDPVPDFRPTIFTNNTNVLGNSGVIDFRVLIGGYLAVNSDGITSVELRIFKNAALNVSFNPALITFNGSPVNNQDWAFDETNPSLYKFTYVGNGGIFQGNTGQFIGVNATYSPSLGTTGFFPLKVIVKYLSGGETNITNNDDNDYIQYKNN